MNISNVIKEQYWAEAINNRDAYLKALIEIQERVKKELDKLLKINY